MLNATARDLRVLPRIVLVRGAVSTIPTKACATSTPCCWVKMKANQPYALCVTRDEQITWLVVEHNHSLCSAHKALFQVATTASVLNATARDLRVLPRNVLVRGAVSTIPTKAAQLRHLAVGPR